MARPAGESGEMCVIDSRGSSNVARVPATAAWGVIRCPLCHGRLARAGDDMLCESCGKLLRFESGVLCCVEKDSFYEDTYLNQVRHVPGHTPLKDWVFFSL